MRKICGLKGQENHCFHQSALYTNRIMKSKLCAEDHFYRRKAPSSYHPAQIWKCSLSKTLLLPNECSGERQLGLPRVFLPFAARTQSDDNFYGWEIMPHKRHLSSVTCGSSLFACTCELRLFLSAPILTQSRAASLMETGKYNVSTFMCDGHTMYKR